MRKLKARSATLLVSFWLATILASYVLAPIFEEQYGIEPTLPKIIKDYVNNPEGVNLPSFLFNQLFSLSAGKIAALVAMLVGLFTFTTLTGSTNFIVYYVFPAALIYALLNMLIFPINGILFSTNVEPIVKIAVGGYFIALILITITTFTSGRD